MKSKNIIYSVCISKNIINSFQQHNRYFFKDIHLYNQFNMYARSIEINIKILEDYIIPDYRYL